MWKTSFQKFDGHGMLQAGHTHSNFVKIVFHNFYLVHSWILCHIYEVYSTPFKIKSNFFFIRNMNLLYHLTITQVMKRERESCQQFFKFSAKQTKHNFLDIALNKPEAMLKRGFITPPPPHFMKALPILLTLFFRVSPTSPPCSFCCLVYFLAECLIAPHLMCYFT